MNTEAQLIIDYNNALAQVQRMIPEINGWIPIFEPTAVITRQQRGIHGFRKTGSYDKTFEIAADFATHDDGSFLRVRTALRNYRDQLIQMRGIFNQFTETDMYTRCMKFLNDNPEYNCYELPDREEILHPGEYSWNGITYLKRFLSYLEKWPRIDMCALVGGLNLLKRHLNGLLLVLRGLEACKDTEDVHEENADKGDVLDENADSTALLCCDDSDDAAAYCQVHSRGSMEENTFRDSLEDNEDDFDSCLDLTPSVQDGMIDIDEMYPQLIDALRCAIVGIDHCLALYGAAEKPCDSNPGWPAFLDSITKDISAARDITDQLYIHSAVFQTWLTATLGSDILARFDPSLTNFLQDTAEELLDSYYVLYLVGLERKKAFDAGSLDDLEQILYDELTKMYGTDHFEDQHRKPKVKYTNDTDLIQQLNQAKCVLSRILTTIYIPDSS